MTRSWFGGWADLADICHRSERERRREQSRRARGEEPTTNPYPWQPTQAVYNTNARVWEPITVDPSWAGTQSAAQQLAYYDEYRRAWNAQYVGIGTNQWIEINNVTTAANTLGGWYQTAGTAQTYEPTWQLEPTWQPQPFQTQILTQMAVPTHTWGTVFGTGVGVNVDTGWGYQETEEQKAERRRQAHLDDLAAQRAKALLLEHLSEEQRREYEEKQYFHVLGQGGRLYRIKYGSAGNVYRLGTDGNVDAKFCIHASDSVPHEDNMLAQMLLLRFDEEQFLATANRHY